MNAPVGRGRDQPLPPFRDHFILKVGARWFLTGSSAPWWTGRNPGVVLYSSADLKTWRFERWLVDAAQLSDDCPYNGRFWAPEIHAAHGRFWLTVNSGRPGPLHGERRMDEHRIFLFVADTIDGDYALLTPRGLGLGFKNDASLFTDDDGRSYLYCSGGGLWQAPIDLPSGKLLAGDDLVRLCAPRDAGLPDWMIGGIEGPFVIKRHGGYWMFFSSWTRGYEVGVLRAPAPLGPWTLHPREPIFGTRKREYRQRQAIAGGYGHLQYEDTADPYAETGHGAVFRGADGNDWFCCHYLPMGKTYVEYAEVIEYTDTAPALGMAPMEFRDDRFFVHGPV